MMDISTPEVFTNVQKISQDPDINFPGNGNFQNPKFSVSGEIFRPDFSEGNINYQYCNIL